MYLIKGINHFSQPPVSAPVSTLQDATGLLCLPGTLLSPAYLDPTVHQDPQVLFSWN